MSNATSAVQQWAEQAVRAKVVPLETMKSLLKSWRAEAGDIVGDLAAFKRYMQAKGGLTAAQVASVPKPGGTKTRPALAADKPADAPPAPPAPAEANGEYDVELVLALSPEEERRLQRGLTQLDGRDGIMMGVGAAGAVIAIVAGWGLAQLLGG